MPFIVALLMPIAHAGIIDWLCDKLIMDSPYQFEQCPDEYCLQAIKPLEIREKWGRLNVHEASMLHILREEIARREEHKRLYPSRAYEPGRTELARSERTYTPHSAHERDSESFHVQRDNQDTRL